MTNRNIIYFGNNKQLNSFPCEPTHSPCWSGRVLQGPPSKTSDDLPGDFLDIWERAKQQKEVDHFEEEACTATNKHMSIMHMHIHIQSYTVYECTSTWCVLCLLWYIVRNNINKQCKCKWQGPTKSSTLEQFLFVTLWIEQGTRNQHWYHHFITSIFQSWFVMWCQHLIFISPGWLMRGSPKIEALATQEVPPQCNSIVAYLAFTVWLLGTWLTLLRWEPKSTQEIIPCPQCFKTMFHTQWETRGLVLDLLLIYGVYWRPICGGIRGSQTGPVPPPVCSNLAAKFSQVLQARAENSWVTWFDLY